jgi:hypothetical protein
MRGMNRHASIAVAAAALLAGCGSSRSTTPTSPQTPTVATAPPAQTTPSDSTLVTAADAVCDRYEKRILALQTPTVFLGHDASDARAIAADELAERTFAEHLARVPSHPPERQIYLRFVRAVNAQVADDQRIIAALARHDDNSANDASQDVDKQVATEAHVEDRLGLTDCAHPS